MFILRIAARILASILDIVQIMMIIRAILSWFPTNRSNKFFDTVYMVTDYIVRPVRTFMVRHNIGTSLPIDLSFLVTFIMISFVQRILYMI